MNLDYPRTVSGYMDEDDMQYLAQAASKASSIVEIGSWHGRSACALAANTTGTVHCVDTWSGDLTGLSMPLNLDLFTQFILSTAPYRNVIPVRADSLTAAKYFGISGATFDLIFIDGTHDYESAKADIIAWRPLLRAGGVMCGHDWGNQYPGVEIAVTEQIGKVNVVDKIWWTEIGNA